MGTDRSVEPEGPKVKCPGCGAVCAFAPANQWRPFCSERCRSLDLGAWASERYRVTGQAETAPDADVAGDPS
jgi:endogenous inhibitor of DNA gyrase (YacG/DUF329 family)